MLLLPSKSVELQFELRVQRWLKSSKVLETYRFYHSRSLSFRFKGSNVDETNTAYLARRLSVSLSRCSKAPRLGLHDPRATCSTRALKVWGLGGDARGVWGAAALVLRPHQRPPRRRRTLPRLPYAGAEARGQQGGAAQRVMGGVGWN